MDLTSCVQLRIETDVMLIGDGDAFMTKKYADIGCDFELSAVKLCLGSSKYDLAVDQEADADALETLNANQFSFNYDQIVQHSAVITEILKASELHIEELIPDIAKRLQLFVQRAVQCQSSRATMQLTHFDANSDAASHESYESLDVDCFRSSSTITIYVSPALQPETLAALEHLVHVKSCMSPALNLRHARILIACAELLDGSCTAAKLEQACTNWSKLAQSLSAPVDVSRKELSAHFDSAALSQLLMQPSLVQDQCARL